MMASARDFLVLQSFLETIEYNAIFISNTRPMLVSVNRKIDSLDELETLILKAGSGASRYIHGEGTDTASA